MTFDEYQKLALRTGRGKDAKNELFHLTMGLVGESAEVSERMKKLIRDLDSDESKLDKDDIAKELGDVLWYIAVLADYFDLPLSDVAKKNIDKLASRFERGVIGGSGDNR